MEDGDLLLSSQQDGPSVSLYIAGLRGGREKGLVAVLGRA